MEWNGTGDFRSSSSPRFIGSASAVIVCSTNFAPGFSAPATCWKKYR